MKNSFNFKIIHINIQKKLISSTEFHEQTALIIISLQFFH